MLNDYVNFDKQFLNEKNNKRHWAPNYNNISFFRSLYMTLIIRYMVCFDDIGSLIIWF